SRPWAKRWIRWFASSNWLLEDQGPGYLAVSRLCFIGFSAKPPSPRQTPGPSDFEALMLTCFPRCFACSMAIALMVPSLPAQAATIGASDVEGVCLARTFKTGVG